jgi:hypothetical protein
MRKRHWVQAAKSPSPSEKAAIGVACSRFIADVLKPRFLPEIRVTEFNYPVDIGGKWHGRYYRFFQRYRANGPHSEGGEFEAPFARLEYVAPDRFDISFHRHTGQWWPLHRGVSLDEALRLLVGDGRLHPL